MEGRWRAAAGLAKWAFLLASLVSYIASDAAADEGGGGDGRKGLCSTDLTTFLPFPYSNLPNMVCQPLWNSYLLRVLNRLVFLFSEFVNFYYCACPLLCSGQKVFLGCPPGRPHYCGCSKYFIITPDFYFVLDFTSSLLLGSIPSRRTTRSRSCCRPSTRADGWGSDSRETGRC